MAIWTGTGWSACHRLQTHLGLSRLAILRPRCTLESERPQCAPEIDASNLAKAMIAVCARLRPQHLGIRPKQPQLSSHERSDIKDYLLFLILIPFGPFYYYVGSRNINVPKPTGSFAHCRHKIFLFSAGLIRYDKLVFRGQYQLVCPRFVFNPVFCEQLCNRLANCLAFDQFIRDHPF